MVSKAITPTAAASSSPVIMFGCPSRSLIKPCLCNDLVKGLEIFCEGLQPIKLKSVLEHLEMNEKIIVYMKIKNTYMPTLPDELFGLIRIRHLMIHNCHLGTMKQSTFSQTGEEIESLDLSKNQFTKIPKALGVLINLVSLNLNYNRIESIESNAFEGLRSLLRLFLFGNKIHTIHPHAFIGIAFNVTRINLGGNHLSSIPSDALQSLKSIQSRFLIRSLLLVNLVFLVILKRLQLHENKIHRIQRKHFHRLRNLDNLDVINLAGNLLQSLDANAFYDLKALNSIDLEMNRISTIDPMAFNGLQDSLEWLKLDSNELAEVPTSALNLLTKLRELDLRNNFIEKIHTESFRNFGSKIKFLYLQKNRIDFIANDSFQNLSSIEWLYLNSNQLKHLPKRLFETIIERNLTILDLHGELSFALNRFDQKNLIKFLSLPLQFYR
ncbi:Leucine rich repeat containing protein 8 [Sarcoptes scabiei]|uniref:Leucine rich repeat containing protein 8 n=1 Tax=Sarcoptes scabiei TaxID=52283 RepID=A0A132A6B3_SARSC|nr:Leucine rich repeat containing protein 8 [Sarcoptes scabiei]